jgi:hypothetical protein
MIIMCVSVIELIYDRVDISGGDGMASSTQVPSIRCVWTHVAVSCRVRH